jgi:hypothetical protein
MDMRKNTIPIGRRGSVSVIVALSLVVLAGMAAFAVDYGFLQYKRSQLQTAADTAALAGASTLLTFGDSLDQVAATAVTYAQANLGGDDVPGSAVTAGDVGFYNSQNPTVQTTQNVDQVEVTVGRSSDRGNPVQLFLGPILGKELADVGATARASLFCARSSNCLKPLSPPAKFTWDDSCDEDKKLNGNGLLDYASSCELESVEVQGYHEGDLGTQIVLKQGDNTDNAVNGHYNPVDFPPSNKGNPISGAAEYRVNLGSDCSGSNNTPVEPGDTLQVEPGNMVGPTKQGLSDLFADDPGAYWDSGSNSIKGSSFADPMDSPRVALFPFYDPSIYQPSGRNDVQVYQLGAVFIEGIDGKGDVTGRFIRAMGASPQGGVAGCDTADFGLYGAHMDVDSTRMQ